MTYATAADVAALLARELDTLKTGASRPPPRSGGADAFSAGFLTSLRRSPPRRSTKTT